MTLCCCSCLSSYCIHVNTEGWRIGHYFLQQFFCYPLIACCFTFCHCHILTISVKKKNATEKSYTSLEFANNLKVENQAVSIIPLQSNFLFAAYPPSVA